MGAELVKKDFELFLKTHVPDACLDNVDEIVLDYVAEVLGDLGREQGESSFDVDQFSEMISAYVPDFSSIECSVVCQWVFELAEKQKAVKPRMEDSRSQKPAAPKTEQTSKAKLRTKTRGGNGEKSTEGTTSTNDTATGDGGEVSLLREMFPSVGEETISAVLMKCQGDMEEAIQQLLALPEEITRGREMEVKTRGQTRHLADPSRTEVCGDKDIKESLLARYSFVDTKEDKVTHRPVLSKPEPKKMVRYRKGHVVNTKGERFTVLTKKDTEGGEDMKKTYVNLNPLRKYRFH